MVTGLARGMSANVANKKKKKKDDEPEEVRWRESDHLITESCLGGGREAGEENIRDGFVWSREGFIQLASVNVWTQCKTSIPFPDAKK